MLEAGAGSSERFLFRTRFALRAGFGDLLPIMALAGASGIRFLQHIRREEYQIRGQFLLQNHALNDLRSQLYLSGTYVRDYLLEPEPHRAEAHLESLRLLRAAQLSRTRSRHTGPDSSASAAPPAGALHPGRWTGF